MNLLETYIKEVLDGFSMSGTRWWEVPHNLRYDVNLSPVRNSNVLDDVKQPAEENQNKAAICLVRRNDGKILAVSRGIGSNMWGMPGGHVEPGESFQDAAVRELKEETGCTAITCNQIFFDRNIDGYDVACFACKIKGNIRSSLEGDVCWVDISILKNPKTSAYSEYFIRMVNELGL